MTDLLVLAAFVVGGLPIGLLLLTRVQALLAAAIISSVLATVAAVLHVALDLPIGLIWVVLVLASVTVITLVPRLRTRVMANLRQPVGGQEYLHLSITGVLVLFVAVLVPAPIAWDARSIWLFHGSWLTGPAVDYLDGLALPELVFSHPDYPLLGPGSMAVTWNLTGQAEDLTNGVRLIALLSLSAVAFVATATLSRITRDVHPVLTSLAFVLFTTSVLPLAAGLLDEGYLDAMQAAYVVALVAVLLPSLHERMPWRSAMLASILAVAAVNVKQEGFWFVLAVLCSFLVVSFRTQNVAKYVPLAVTLGAYGVWKVFLAANGAIDTSDASGIAGKLPELVTPGSRAWEVLGRLAATEWAIHVLPVLIVLLLALCGYFVLRRDPSRLRTALFLLIAWLGLNVIVMLTYALGDSRDVLDWWLATSFVRVIATALLLAFFAVMVVVVSVPAWRSESTKAEVVA